MVRTSYYHKKPPHTGLLSYRRPLRRVPHTTRPSFRILDSRFNAPISSCKSSPRSADLPDIRLSRPSARGVHLQTAQNQAGNFDNRPPRFQPRFNRVDIVEQLITESPIDGTSTRADGLLANADRKSLCATPERIKSSPGLDPSASRNRIAFRHRLTINHHQRWKFWGKGESERERVCVCVRVCVVKMVPSKRGDASTPQRLTEEPSPRRTALPSRPVSSKADQPSLMACSPPPEDGSQYGRSPSPLRLKQHEGSPSTTDGQASHPISPAPSSNNEPGVSDGMADAPPLPISIQIQSGQVCR